MLRYTCYICVQNHKRIFYLQIQLVDIIPVAAGS
jgi:hypothetical protein